MIEQSASTIAVLEADKDGLVREKTSREMEIEDLNRQIRESDSEKGNFVHLKQVEFLNQRQTHEQAFHLS